MNQKSSFTGTMVAVCLLCGAVDGARGKGTGPADGLKEVPVSLVIRSNWNRTEDDGDTVVGACSATISGMIHLVEGEEGTFAPKGGSLKAILHYDNVHKDDKGKLKWEEHGEGVAPVGSPFDAGTPAPLDKGQFVLKTVVGQAARIFVLQLMQNADPLALMKALQSKENQDIYLFKAMAPVRTTVTSSDGSTRANAKVAAFSLHAARLTPGVLSGSPTWKGKTIAGVLDAMTFPLKDRGPPEEPDGDVTYSVKWRFGKTPPQVIIYQVVDGMPYDVTDKEDEKDEDRPKVLVGRKVRLKASLFPPGQGGAGTWTIDSKIIKDWKADTAKGTVLKFEDHSREEIEFAWVDGEFGGARKVATYKAGEVTGKATFLVYRPKVTLDLKPPETVDCAMIGQANSTGQGEPTLFLYRNNSPLFGIHGKSVLTMPADFTGHPQLQQYVQLVQENDLVREGSYRDGAKMTFSWSKRKTRNWEAGKFDSLDTRYPLGGSPSDTIQDTPQLELNRLTVEAYVWNKFETYLMFLPSADKDDPSCVWVPMRKFAWAWRGSCRRRGDIQWEGGPTVFDFEKGPHHITPPPGDPPGCTDHPEWTANIEDLGKKWSDANPTDFTRSGHRRFTYTPPP